MMEPTTIPPAPATRNVWYYVAGLTGVVFGLGMMGAAVVGTRNQSAFMARLPGGSSSLIVAGQLVASAGGFVAVIPLIRRRLRAARAVAGQCRSCGYDLKGNLSGVCPECGTRRQSDPG